MEPQEAEKKAPKRAPFFKKIFKGTSWFGNKTLSGIEKVGNKLPKPFFLFIYLTIFVMIVSLILSFIFSNGIILNNVYDRKEAKIVPVYKANFYNFFSGDGIIWILKNFIPNFMNLPVIGIVLITGLFAMVAEKSGFIDVGMKKLAYSIPSKALTPITIALGSISSIISDAGYLILIPLAGVLYHKVHRHPVIGIVAMFAGVSGGFAANLIPASSEFTLVSSTNNFVGKDVVNALSNWYFTILLIGVYSLIGWFVTEQIIAKRIVNKYFVDAKHDQTVDKFIPIKYRLKPNERRAMWWVLGFTLVYLSGIFLLMFIPRGPFNAPFNAEFAKELGENAKYYNVLEHLVLLVGFFFLGVGIVYGYVSRNFKKRDDLIDALLFGFKRIVPSFLIFIIMAQFIAVLGQTKIDIVLAYYIGNGVKGLPLLLTIFIFIMLVAFINLFMGGLSTKWFVLGPIFVIALQDAGIHPAATIMAYRLGDGATNIISPIMVYFPMVLGFAHDWLNDKSKQEFKTGSLLSLMAPYAFFFLIGSSLIFLIWFAFGIPVGVGGPIYINPDIPASTPSYLYVADKLRFIKQANWIFNSKI